MFCPMTKPALLLAVLFSLWISGLGLQDTEIPDLCTPQEIPASHRVIDLSELTFWGKVADGRVWFVEFYAGWCRGCKRVAGHVSMLADHLATTHSTSGIAVGRLDCGHAEGFCDRVIGVTRTPSFKVYFQGKKAIDYNAEFFFFDMMLAFITDTATNLQGFSLPSSRPNSDAGYGGNHQGLHLGDGDDDDDEYE